MSPLRQMVRRAHRKLSTPRTIARLERDADPRMRTIGAALAASYGEDELTAEEMWVRRIEAVRGEIDGDGDGDGDVPPPEEGRVLLRLTRTLRPSRAVAVGARAGAATAYQAAGLELAAGGRVVAVRGAESDGAGDGGGAREARGGEGRWSALGLEHRVVVRTGPIDEELDALGCGDEAVDWLYVDGRIGEEIAGETMARLVERVAANAVIVFGDVASTREARRAWARWVASTRVQRVVDLFGLGIALVGGPPPGGRRFVAMVKA